MQLSHIKLIILYISAVMIGMMFSLATKRGIPLVMKDGLRTINVSKRCYSFSSSSSSSWSHNAGKTSSSMLAGLGDVQHPNFNITVAYHPKDREESNIFKLKKKERSPAQDSPTGEDNYFVSKPSGGAVAVGVADGVGGWSEAGYDSSAISRELCNFLQDNFENNDNPDVLPKELLSKSFDDVLSSSKVYIGGTTACLGIFTPDSKLHVANLGDSWCGLFRDYKLVNETNFQTHNFNTPFQLAKIPEEIVSYAASNDKRYIMDIPASADEYTWDLKKDDIVLFATDGVTDNVVPQDIENFLKDSFTQGLSQQEISNSFVKEVVKISTDPNFPSTFAQELSRLTGQKYLGGKEDDITVVMVKVL